MAGLVYSVVEQCSPPQGGILAEEHAMDASQPLFSGVDGLQAMFFPAPTAAPRLMAVVDASEVMCTCQHCRFGRESPVLLFLL